jgi:hypothetical protein
MTRRAMKSSTAVRSRSWITGDDVDGLGAIMRGIPNSLGNKMSHAYGWLP